MGSSSTARARCRSASSNRCRVLRNRGRAQGIKSHCEHWATWEGGKVGHSSRLGSLRHLYQGTDRATGGRTRPPPIPWVRPMLPNRSPRAHTALSQGLRQGIRLARRGSHARDRHHMVAPVAEPQAVVDKRMTGPARQGSLVVRNGLVRAPLLTADLGAKERRIVPFFPKKTDAGLLSDPQHTFLSGTHFFEGSWPGNIWGKGGGRWRSYPD